MDVGLKGFTSNLAKVGKQAATIGAGIGVAFAGAAVASLTAWTKESLSAIDATSKLSDRVGVSTEALTGWAYGAGLSGVAVDKLQDGLKDLTLNLGKARDGITSNADAFKALGVDINSGNTEDVFKATAEAISKIEDPAQQASAAVSVFGESGYHLLGFLKQGEAGIDAMANEAERLGITFSRVDGAQIEMANDAFSKLGTIATSIGNKLAIELAPIITGIASSLLDATNEGFSFGDIVSTGIDWIVKGLGVVLDVVHTVKLGFKALQGIIISGFAHSLDAIVFFGKGLESLLNMIPGVEVSFGSMLEGIQDSLHASANEIFEQVNQDLVAATPSEGLNNWLDDVRNKSKEAAEAIANAAQTTSDLGDSFAGASDDASKLIDKLTNQIATFGLSSTEAELFKLSTEGVSAELLDQIRALDGQLQALEDSKAKQEELSSAAEAVIEGLKTPLDKYQEEVTQLKELLDTGNINQSQFDKALANATKGLQGESESVFQSPELLKLEAKQKLHSLPSGRIKRTTHKI